MPGKIIVAIDGPSGAGKSTVSKRLADELGYVYIDTGAMYRAIGWKAVKLGVLPKEGPELAALCANTEVRLGLVDGEPKVYVDGEDVTGLIRTPEMSMTASAVSAQPSVRARLLELQRDMGRGGGVVLEGRDIGTVVFPDAGIKFFLVADVAERARRRYEELKAKGVDVDLAKTLEEVEKRDYDDSSRGIAPLVKADDALVVDTTKMTIDEVVAFMKARVEEAADRAGA
ncbi:MAG: (d)CMP kinase [Nitrospirae bacterium]|nr:(d)CMP kinase [Nitrospirota bacterium]